MLTQPLMCIAEPAPPLFSSLSMTISPNLTGLSQRTQSLSPPRSLFSPLSPCIIEGSALSFTVTQPPHGPTGSFTHPVVQPVFVFICVNVTYKEKKSLTLLSVPCLVFFFVPGMREHPPITVANLSDHIERLKANDGLRFSQEYEVRAVH